MKIFVIGLICIWLQNCSAALKWAEVVSGETFVDDLETLKGLDFWDTELKTTVETLVDEALAKRIPKAVCEKESQRMHLDSKTGEGETPCLLWIGFRLLRFAYILWYFALLFSLYVKKDVVIHLDHDEKEPEQAPANEDNPEIPIVAYDDVPDGAPTSVDDIVNAMRGEIAILENNIWVIVDVIDQKEDNVDLEPDDSQLISTFVTDHDVPDDAPTSVDNIVNAMRGEIAILENNIQVITDVIDHEEDNVDLEPDDSQLISTLSAVIESSSSFTDSLSVVVDSSLELDEREDLSVPQEEGAGSELVPSGKTGKSSNIFRRAYRALKGRKKSPRTGIELLEKRPTFRFSPDWLRNK